MGRTHTLLDEDVDYEAEGSERSLQGYESVVGITLKNLNFKSFFFEVRSVPYFLNLK